MNGMGGPEAENGGTYSSMYRWEEKFCTALLDNLFPELGDPSRQWEPCAIDNRDTPL